MLGEHTSILGAILIVYVVTKLDLDVIQWWLQVKIMFVAETIIIYTPYIDILVCAHNRDQNIDRIYLY